MSEIPKSDIEKQSAPANPPKAGPRLVSKPNAAGGRRANVRWWQWFGQRSVRKYISLAMLLIGVALLLYVGSEYFATYREQKDLAQRWNQRQEQREQEQRAGAKASDLPPSADDGLIRVVIPRINVDAFVVEGTTRKDLRLGPGHMSDTALPGENGNAVITAHRDTFFRHIAELTKGDTVLVSRGSKTFRYEVTGKRVVQPTDLSVVKQTPEARLTLITCYPTYYIGPAPERLIVTSKLVGEDPPQAAAVR